MATTERVTVTLPSELVEGIDRIERNRSRFIAQAVARELARHRRQELKKSLANPHPEASDQAEVALRDWAETLPAEDEALVDTSAGKPVRWIEGEGWVEESV